MSEIQKSIIAELRNATHCIHNSITKLQAEDGGVWVTRGELEDAGILPPAVPVIQGEDIYHEESLRSAALVIDGLIQEQPTYEQAVAEVKQWKKRSRRTRQNNSAPLPGFDTSDSF